MSSTSTARSTQTLRDEYVRKLDSALDHDRLGLAAELSADYASEAGLPVAARRPSALRRRSAELLRRLDRHTVKVYNPSWPYRVHDPR